MKGLKLKIATLAVGAAVTATGVIGLTGCGGGGNTTNTLFLYPINYYGIEESRSLRVGTV